MSTVCCLEVKTFGKNKDAAGSGTDGYRTVETRVQPSAGTAAESLISMFPPPPSYCFSPYKKEGGMSISTTSSQPVAPSQVFFFLPLGNLFCSTTQEQFNLLRKSTASTPETFVSRWQVDPSSMEMG